MARKLTDKQEAYKNFRIAGEGVSASYKKAYPNNKSSNKAISVEANKLEHDPRIALAIQEAKKATQKRLEVTVDSQVEEYRALFKEAALLLNEEGGTSSQSIDLRIKTLARMDKICGLEKANLDVSSGGKPIKNEWHIHPVTTAKDG